MDISLENWGSGHLELLRGLNTPEMTEHLGGPETEEQLVARDAKYVRFDALPEGGTYVVLVDGEPAGDIMYWSTGDDWEMGWGVLTAFQGRGVATSAVLLALDAARSERRFRYVHAVPRVSNDASNAVCRRVGFILAGTEDMEYPPGQWSPSNDWIYDLGIANQGVKPRA
jgi:RimJ/RimL family protein N-acetyltransferase